MDKSLIETPRCNTRRMRGRNGAIAFLLILLVAWIPEKAPAQGVTPEAVQEAIDQFSSYFRRTQSRGKGERAGAWQGHDEYGAGLTSLVVLALLSSGSSPDSAEVARGLTYIRIEQPEKVYEASLQCMALCAANPGRDRDLIERNVKWLLEVQQKDGGWGYGRDFGSSDESNTQFAVLALWEASKLGVKIPVDKLDLAKKYWMTKRLPGDTWGYRSERTPRGSMTCAGIASMIILEDALISEDATVEGDQIVCCGGGQVNRNYSTEVSLEWLAKYFSVNDNPGFREWHMYYLYALERVGRLTGRRFIGDHDWYREGAEAILKRRDPVGGKMQGSSAETEVAATAMALLFLSKGKRQVVIGHLQHGFDPSSNDWNRYRRSVQHLTGHVEQAWKRDLAWQSIRIDRATLPDLLETPILFISGSKEFQLTPQQRTLLKDYVDQGGFIFAEACNGNGCEGTAFDESFRREMESLFKRPFQKLPPSHPIWSAETRINPEALPEGFWLYGLEACCRTSVLLSPTSLSCRWELSKPYGAKPSFSKKVQDELDNAVKIGLNVVAYATGRELKDKLDSVQIVQTDLNRQTEERGSLAIAKIMHSGGGDETPRSLPNLLELYRRETRAMVQPKTPKLAANSPELDKYPIAYIQGRSKFVFSDDELTGIQRHLRNGGMVLGDAICGSEDFAASVRREFSRALPEAIWRTLPPDHPLLLKEGPGGFDLRNVLLIDPNTGGKDLEKAKREGPVEIDALEWNGRLVVLFSPNDLSCAMESKHSLQCRGYTREDAFRIGMNMLLYALMQ
jgi:hypothetical protein